MSLRLAPFGPRRGTRGMVAAADQLAAVAAKEAQIEELRQRLDQVEKLVRHSEDYASH